MNLPKLYEHLIAGEALTATEMQQVMNACMSGEFNDAQIAAFLALMRMKGETIEELTSAAKVMMDFAHCVDLGADLIDIVGTGGDGKNTFNISTLSSIIAAAAGARVAKHGNRSISSRSGSADLLMEAGLKLDLSDEQLKDCLQQTNICFLFAPHFHRAMQQVRNARMELGIRTFFNILGPLINPAKVKKQVVGVFDKRWQQPLAQVLANMGSERAMVVTSRDGMDEVSIADLTDVVEYHRGEFTHWVIDPNRYQCYHRDINELVVDSPAQSLTLILSVLAGKKGPARDIALLNSAIALYCANVATDFQAAVQLAASTIDSGKAKHCYDQLIAFSRQIK